MYLHTYVCMNVCMYFEATAAFKLKRVCACTQIWTAASCHWTWAETLPFTITNVNGLWYQRMNPARSLEPTTPWPQWEPFSLSTVVCSKVLAAVRTYIYVRKHSCISSLFSLSTVVCSKVLAISIVCAVVALQSRSRSRSRTIYSSRSRSQCGHGHGQGHCWSQNPISTR